MYSTWYAFNQDVTAASVEAQAGPAVELGCGVLILDDGWQRHGNGRGYAGCGDWQPDPAKFPDLAGHVARVRDRGLRYLLWVAPSSSARRPTATSAGPLRRPPRPPSRAPGCSTRASPRSAGT
ncbi:alpha-galactosidase [Streptomyces diastatochromogenes]|nr:alpha-galactosidase [Streptomyces diastatochromogenes]